MDKYSFKGIPYYICDLDARGAFIDPDAVARVVTQDLSCGAYDDVVVFSHGYNVMREKDGSLDLMNDVVPNMEARKPDGRRVLYIAIKWPSFITTVFDGDNKNPKKLASELIRMVAEAVGVEKTVNTAVTAGTGTMSRSMSKHAEDNLAILQQETEVFLADAPDTDDECANGVANGNAAVPSTNVITEPPAVYVQTANGNDTTNDNGELPPKICRSIANLVNELNKQSEQDDGDDTCLLDDSECRYKNVTADGVRKRFEEMRAKNSKPAVPASRPADCEKSNGAETQVSTRSYTIIGTILALKKAWDFAHTLNDFFFGTFERRACVIGSVGVHKLLLEIMGCTTSATRVHLFGHSLGAHVMQSAAIGRGPPKQLPRKIHCLVLAQGACSTNCYGVGGPYRPIVSKLVPIAGPILGTVFYGDLPLLSYNAFYPRPLGRFGFDSDHVTPFDVEKITVKSHEFPTVGFRKRTCYSLIGKGIVTEHGDVGDLELMSLFWQAATIDMKDKDYDITPNAKLPAGYWYDFDIRTEKSKPQARTRDGFGCPLM